MKAIEISNLYYSFQTSKGEVSALMGVDLSVSSGIIFGLLGPNGAGKTTALDIVTTRRSLDKGSASVMGLDVKTRPHEVRKQIGYVSQKGGADRNATGWEDLMLAGMLQGMDKSTAEKKAKELVATFSLEACIDRFVSSYSGGQKRRLDIATSMMHSPKVLFLDEPTTGLDPQNREHLWQKILKLKNAGTTILLTSHYLDEVDHLSDQLAIMDKGKIVASGTPSSLKREISGDIITLGLKEPLQEKVGNILQEESSLIRKIVPAKKQLRLIVEKGESALPKILQLLEQRNIPVHTVELSSPSLNDIFLQKTGRSLREEATT